MSDLTRKSKQRQEKKLFLERRVVGGFKQRGAKADGDVRVCSSVRKLTAQRSDRSVDGLDKDALVGNLVIE